MSEGMPEGTPVQGNEGQQSEGQPQSGQQGQTGQPNAGTDNNAEIERLRGELRKFRRMEDQLKAMKPKAEKFDELQQSVMTAEERADAAVRAANERITSAESRATTAERELAAYRAGVKYKLEEDDLVFIKNLPAEEIEKAAQQLAKRLGKVDTPNFDGGPRTNPPATDDIGEFLRNQIDRARGRR
jgi:hypothetical protein